MIRLQEILKAFSNLVGWEGVTESESGLYFQDAHPLLTTRAMRELMPSDYIAKFEPYNDEKVYSLNSIVQDGNSAYISLKNGNTESIYNELAWREYDLFTDYLNTFTTRGIKRAVNKFMQDKIVGLESRNVIDRRTLFDGAGRKEARTRNSGKLVGFEIVPLRANGITTILNKVGVQFYGNIGKVKLYLFHSSQTEPIATKEIDYTNERGGFMWFDLDWTLPYVNDSINAGGNWYVCYNEKALPPYMESINFGRDWGREPCGTCNKGDVNLYRLMQKYVTFSPFYVAIGDDWDESLWDLEDTMYCNGNNYGLNFMFSMACDVTDAVLVEKHQFASVIQLEVANDALRTLAFNPDVNVHRVLANVDRDNILFETEGNGQGVKGLRGELEKAYKALSIDTKGLDPVCMTCHNKGVRFSTI